jgi:hypothetical protein
MLCSKIVTFGSSSRPHLDLDPIRNRTRIRGTDPDSALGYTSGSDPVMIDARIRFLIRTRIRILQRTWILSRIRALIRARIRIPIRTWFRNQVSDLDPNSNPTLDRIRVSTHAGSAAGSSNYRFRSCRFIYP